MRAVERERRARRPAARPSACGPPPRRRRPHHRRRSRSSRMLVGTRASASRRSMARRAAPASRPDCWSMIDVGGDAASAPRRQTSAARSGSPSAARRWRRRRSAMQTKKNSRRRHDARISRAAMRRTNVIVQPPARAMRSVGDRPPVAQHQPRVGHRGQFGSCVTRTSVTLRACAYLQQQVDDVPAVRAVEIAGRLVGQDQRRIVGQRARDRDALLLAARELRRVVMPAIVQPDFVEQRLRARRRIPPAGDLHRHQDVLERRQRRHQVEELEDEADLLAAQPRQRVLVEPA